MIPITRALIAEHEMLLVLFEEVEKLLPGHVRLGEVRRAARMVEGLLLNHAEVEEDLLLLARAQVSAERRWYERCHKEHQEIDSRLTQVRSARNVARARSLLRGALAASRKHFKVEELKVFPLIERGVKPETLIKLGTTWFLQRHAPTNWTL
jgi:hemerythrin-like domain-containing protein